VAGKPAAPRKPSIRECNKSLVVNPRSDRSFFPFPLLQLQKAKRRRRRFPAAISPVSFFSGHRSGAGKGGWPGNRRTGVDRLGSSPRSRVRSPSVDGGARVCREGGIPLQLVFLGAVGEEEAMGASLNKFSRPLPHTGGVFLRHQRRGR
jgi:hypothetical protein